MTVYVNGTLIPFVKKGLVINEKLNEEFDSCNLVFYSKTFTDSIRPFSLVRIVIGSENLYFLVHSSECSLVSKVDDLYQHNLVLVELTHQLTTILVDNISITAPLEGNNINVLQAVQRIIDITPLSLENNHSSERLFSISSATQNILDDYVCPELVLENKTLLEVLIELYKIANLFPLLLPQVNGKYVISHIDFNEFQEVEDEITFKVGISKHMSASDFIGSLTMNVENAINESGELEVFPGENRFFTIISPEQIATSDNVLLKLPNPIYKIVKVELLMWLKGEDNLGVFPPKPDDKYAKAIDITDYVFEKKIYDTLELDTGNFNQSNSLFYVQYEDSIRGLGNTVQNVLGFATPALERIILNVDIPDVGGNTMLRDSKYSNYATESLFNGKYGFRVSYIPTINNKIKIFKDPIESSDVHLHGQYSNQSTNKPNVLALIGNIKSTLNRSGNRAFNQEVVVNSFANRIKLGQKYGDYVVSEVVHKIIDENFIKSTATFSKDFNRLSLQIGINKEERQYRILAEATTNRNLTYNDFIVVNSSAPISVGSSFTTTGKNFIFNQFSSSAYNSDSDRTIKSAFIKTYDSQDNLIGYFLFDITKMDALSYNAFFMNFQSNTSAYKFLNRLVDSGLSSSSLLTSLFGSHVSLMRSTKYTVDAIMEKMTIQLFNVPNIELSGYFLESYLFTYPLSTYTTGSKVRYTVQDNGGGSYTYRLAEWNEDTPGNTYWDYFDTDRESILNDFYNGFYSQRFDFSIPTSSKNPTAWFDEEDVVSNTAPGAKNIIVELNKLIVKKDQGEKISFNYQLNYVTKDSNIFWGNFAKNNQIYSSHNNNELYCFLSTTQKYKTGDTKAKGDSLETSWQFSRTTTTNYIKLSLQYNLANYQLAGGQLASPTQQQIEDYLLANVKSWGIATAEGDLYVGVNMNGANKDMYIYLAHSL